MDWPMAWGDFALLVACLLAGGLVTGFLAGLLGIGGGGILVPVLYELFGVLGADPASHMHLVLGTSFAIILPTAMRSFASHRAKGAADLDVVRRLAPFVLVGVVVGVFLVSSVSTWGLKAVWIAAASLLALKMAFGRDDWRLTDALPNSWVVSGVAALIGLVSTLMSIGGGMFFVSMFTFSGWPLLRAIATSSGFGPVIAAPALVGYVWAGWGVPGLPPFSLGYVNLLAAALVIPASVFAAPFGVRAAHGISRRALERAFAVFLAVVALRLFVSLL